MGIDRYTSGFRREREKPKQQKEADGLSTLKRSKGGSAAVKGHKKPRYRQQEAKRQKVNYRQRNEGIKDEDGGGGDTEHNDNEYTAITILE